MSANLESSKKFDSKNYDLRKSRIPNKVEEKFIGPYEIIDFIKEGSSSKIYLAKSNCTNEKVVIKAIKKSRFHQNLEDLLLLEKEIESLKILKHRNIITLYEIYESQKYIYLVREYCPGKDLIEKIKNKNRFSQEEALVIFFQLLDAFIYMHKMNICHRNIRTEHILFDKNNKPKIIGFGYSSFYKKNEKLDEPYGSLCYACPEIIDEQPYNPELADVYSLGVILYVLICGYLPFSDEDDNQNKTLISEGKIEYPKEINNKLKDLLKHMLDKDPKKRYNFQKIIKHPWIKPFSEEFLSQGINIYKTTYPTDEAILNYISNKFHFDKEKIKNDLIKNKYNNSTGLYKQLVRKSLDLNIQNKSDLFCEEFNRYRDDDKNQIKDGDKKFEEYLKNSGIKMSKRESYIDEFIKKEENITEQLLQLKENKDGDKSGDELDYEEEKEDENDKKFEEISKNVNNIFEDEDNKSKDNADELSLNTISSKENIINEQVNNNNLDLEKTESDKSEKIKSTLKDDNINELNIGKKSISEKMRNKNENDMKFIKTFKRSGTLNQSKLKRNNRSIDKSSKFDNDLKKRNPKNIKKTILISKYRNKYENDVIEEKDEGEDEKKEKNLKPKIDLGLIRSFHFDEEEEEKEEENNIDNDDMIDVMDREGDSKVMDLLNNDDDEEIKELKKLYYGNNIKESVKFIKKSILKKKSIQIKEDNKKEDEKIKNKAVKFKDIKQKEDKKEEKRKNNEIKNDVNNKINLDSKKVNNYKELENNNIANNINNSLEKNNISNYIQNKIDDYSQTVPINDLKLNNMNNKFQISHSSFNIHSIIRHNNILNISNNISLYNSFNSQDKEYKNNDNAFLKDSLELSNSDSEIERLNVQNNQNEKKSNINEKVRSNDIYSSGLIPKEKIFIILLALLILLVVDKMKY